MQRGWSHPQHSRQAEPPEPAPTPAPGQATAVQPTMEHRAEINRFAIFLFCLLVPLGSSAPTETSESKMTTGVESFTTDIKHMSAVIQDEAHNLFQFYKKCVSATLPPELLTARPNDEDLEEIIVECPAFQANCCVLHHIHNILKTLENDIETICNESSKNIVKANLNQLDITLTQGTAFYTCEVQDPPQGQTMSLADTKTYIWRVLKKYEDIMKTAVKPYSRAAF